jgi:hypothetical protein
VRFEQLSPTDGRTASGRALQPAIKADFLARLYRSCAGRRTKTDYGVARLHVAVYYLVSSRDDMSGYVVFAGCTLRHLGISPPIRRTPYASVDNG